MTEPQDGPLERIAAALADLPHLAEPLARYLEALVSFKRAAEAMVDAVAEQEMWVPSLDFMPPTRGTA
jgi:hypothetical protein